jgi:hypothetical protein
MTNDEMKELVGSFVRSHDNFPAGGSAAHDLSHRVSNLVNEGHPVTLEVMDYVWGKMVDEGYLNTHREAVAQTRSYGLTPEQEAERFSELSTQEMGMYLRSKGVL